MINTVGDYGHISAYVAEAEAGEEVTPNSPPSVYLLGSYNGSSASQETVSVQHKFSFIEKWIRVHFYFTTFFSLYRFS